MSETRIICVLVAEDDASLRYLAERQIVKLGYQCDLAHDGKDAVEKAKFKKYDLIIMDVQMPIMDGLEASKEIRRNEQEDNSSTTPIMAMSANPHKQQCYDAGMNDFIFKPVLLSQLRTSLGKWLKPAV